MHTGTRSDEKCWLILLRTAWRLSFEGIQYARSIEGIQHARVLVSCTRIRLVRTFSLRCLPYIYAYIYFFSTRCLPFVFPTSSKTVSLRCSFRFHVDSNRATAHSSNERRLSASRDISSIRIAITVPCQEHQQKSLVSLFRAIAELSRYDAIICIFAVPAPVCPFGFRNS